jgi:rhamnose utilization protein RhaD (predicted bifunctional aldolase and dehydrogenase)/NAD(P)-dependent dehydrogenase (short-subunit alcohol dehydrogenase family)
LKSLWDEAAARRAIERWGAAGEDVALRTYSARLLGSDPRLVLHGGGNTSVKTTFTDLFDEPVTVLCVKGSGWDLGSIEPAGHPAVRLEPLLRLRQLGSLSDEAMVNAQRQNLMDSAAPNPSVETLLHAFIPEKFIDHTHATALLALANQPDAQALIERLYGGRVACVPYVMPGFALAKRAAEIYDAQPGIEGLVLLNHGLFSFGDTARESYERMIALVTVAEDYLAKAPARAARPVAAADSARVLPFLRGLIAQAAGESWPARWVLDLRGDETALALVNAPDLADWAGRGVATPDHVIRTKRHPWVLPAPPPDDADLSAWRAQAAASLAAFVKAYESYVARHAPRLGGVKALDPLPRVLAVPGLGLIGVGKSAGDAGVAADVAQAWAETLMLAERAERFSPLGEADTFDMEYWSLEQAKIGKAKEPPLARRIAVITGAAGAIGAATALAFAAEGAEVALLDVDEAAVGSVAGRLGGAALALACDVTDRASVEAAFDAVCRRFGGVDIVISNAGSATPGAMTSLADAELRASFDLNFFAHQNFARAAIGVMRAQGMGGVLLFNVSKQALNPGPDFGAYGTAKAALLALVRQYALEHGAEGVRVNALNPDRIRSGLLSETMIETRAAARGVDAKAYMAGNLLGEEVTAEDVAAAFVFASRMTKTTGAVITVDGGNVAAMVR